MSALPYTALSDTHLHTCFSTDSEENPESIISSALKKGLHAICFTDHMDLDYPQTNHDEPTPFTFDIDNYFQTLVPLQKKYQEHLHINIGIELGIMSYLAERNDALIKSAPFDFVIASSHMVSGKDPYYPEFWEADETTVLIRKYYEEMLESVSSFNNYDVLGHLDYIIRYIPDKSYKYSYRNHLEVIEAILKKIIESGHGIEINSGALAKGLPNPNPGSEVIKLYHSLGGEIITMGSDSHIASNLAYGFDQTLNILLDAGFRYYTLFSGRKPEFLKLLS